jgi:predicted nucleic acid-binding protein
MFLVDANVLVYAHRPDADDHSRCRDWLDGALDFGTSVAFSELILSSVVRIVTNPRIFGHPTPLDIALQYVDSLREDQTCVLVAPEASTGEFSRNCAAQPEQRAIESATRILPRSPSNRERNGSPRTATMQDFPACAGAIR